MSGSFPVNLDPSKILEFKNLNQEAKILAAEGKLFESLQKFEHARSICETQQVLNRIQKLKDHIEKCASPKLRVSSVKSDTMDKTDDLGFTPSVKKISSTEGCLVTKDEDVFYEKPRILNDIQNFQKPYGENKKVINHPSQLSSQSLLKFEELKKVAMEFSYEFKFEKALEKFQEALKLCDCPKLKSYIHQTEAVAAKHKKGLENFQDLTETENKLKEGHPHDSLHSNGESDKKTSSSLTPIKKEKYSSLYKRAGKLSSDGYLKEALDLLNEAKSICETDKVLQRIKDIEKLIEEDNQATKKGGDKMIEVTKGFFIFHDIYNKLYPYQREGVTWMWNLYKRNKGGVLGDDMGLGKTFQVIAFLSGMIDANLIKYALIIMPVSLLPVWENEFKKWCPGIFVQCYHGKTKKENERSLLRIQRRGHVLLTSYGMVVNNVKSFTELDERTFLWDYVILDEGHKIKNPTKTTKAVHDIPSRNRLVLTGTPIQNNLRELWALYDFAHQGTLLGSQKTFKMQYETLITRSREKDATVGEKRLGTEMAESLKNLIKPYFLRRTKAEVWKNKDGSSDIKVLEEGIGNLEISNKLNTRKNDLIVWLHMSELQINLYRDFLHSEAVQNILCSKRSPLVELTVLKKICDHPRLLSQRACYELGLNEDLRHQDLLHELDEEAASAPSIENVSDETLISESGKLKFIISLLENLREAGHRTLVFSLSRKILDMIHRILLNRKWKIMRIDGTISKIEERNRRIQLFQHDLSYPVFLLTTQVGGVGITLTAADRVVIYDPSWNPATDSQAVDRAYRIGQKKDVVVYRLITCGSVEEKIYRRQIFKDSITRQATCASDPYRYFSKQELRELFSLENPHHSATQVQLSEMHSSERKTDVHLDEHIAFLYSLNIFGISDHDLMFTKSIEDHTEDNDESCVSKDYIKSKVASAQQSIQAEASIIEQGIKASGCYARPYLEPIPSFKRLTAKDVYKAPLLPDMIDLSKDGMYPFKSDLNDEKMDIHDIDFSRCAEKNVSIAGSDAFCKELEYCESTTSKENKSLSRQNKIVDYFLGGDNKCSLSQTKANSSSHEKSTIFEQSVIVEDTHEQKSDCQTGLPSVSENNCKEKSITASPIDNEQIIGVEKQINLRTEFSNTLDKQTAFNADVDEKFLDVSRINKTENEVLCKSPEKIVDTDYQYSKQYDSLSESDSDISSRLISLQNSPNFVSTPAQKSRFVSNSPMKTQQDLQNATELLNYSSSSSAFDKSPVRHKRTHRRSCARPALMVSDSDTSHQASCPSSTNTSSSKIVAETDESNCSIKNDSFDIASFQNLPSLTCELNSHKPSISLCSVPVKNNKQINLQKSNFQPEKLNYSYDFKQQNERLKNTTRNATSVSLIEKRHDDSIRRITPLKIDRSFNIKPNRPFEEALAASPVFCLKLPAEGRNDNNSSPILTKKKLEQIAVPLESDSEDNSYEIPKLVRKRQVKRISSSESEDSADDLKVHSSKHISDHSLNYSKYISATENSDTESLDVSEAISNDIFNFSNSFGKQSTQNSSFSATESESDPVISDEENVNYDLS